MTIYMNDVDGTHPVYTEPPRTQQELDFRVREIKSRPIGGRNLGDYAKIAKTDTSAVSSSWNRIDREDGRR